MSNQTDEIMEEKRPLSPHSVWRNIGIFFSMLGVFLFVGGFSYGYYQLAQVNTSLAHMVSDLQKRIMNSQKDIAALQQSVDALQQATQKSQALSFQQEQLMSEWRAAQKGDLNKWHVAEALYLVKLANDHAQFTHQFSMAMMLLLRADQMLQTIPDDHLLEIRKSLAADMAGLQAAREINITDLYLRLTALNSQLDQLPLSIHPLSVNAKPDTAALHQTNASWWRAGLDRSWQSLRQIVIVRYNGANALPLVMPEEKTFLYQNLHAQIEGALWGVLYGNAGVYQASLLRLTEWIQKYFMPDAVITKTLLQQMNELRKVNVQPPVINFSGTLQLFDRYFAETGQAKVTQ